MDRRLSCCRGLLCCNLANTHICGVDDAQGAGKGQGDPDHVHSVLQGLKGPRWPAGARRQVPPSVAYIVCITCLTKDCVTVNYSMGESNTANEHSAINNISARPTNSKHTQAGMALLRICQLCVLHIS